MNAKLIAQMLSAQSDKSKLPIAYRCDLTSDAESLARYAKLTNFQFEFVWLLREAGTVLFPIGLGAEAMHVLHWLDEKNGQVIEAYHLHPTQKEQNGEVTYELKPIGWAKAAELASKKPKAFIKPEVLMDVGCQLGIWSSPFQHLTRADIGSNVVEWRNFFRLKGNKMMVDYLEKHMRLELVA